MKAPKVIMAIVFGLIAVFATYQFLNLWHVIENLLRGIL